MKQEIPTISLSLLEKNPTEFANQLGRGFREFGFVGIKDHGIKDVMIAETFSAAREFFAEPLSEKMRYHVKDGAGQRGYTPPKVETAVGHQHPDLKEFCHLGRDLPAGHAKAGEFLKNVEIPTPPNFMATQRRLFRALEDAGNKVLRGIALHLGEREDFFVHATEYGNSILRTLHYPPIEDAAPGQVRAGAHTDINLITLLVGSGEAGLEVQTRTGHWIPITTIPGTIICNIGDMMQRLTNHALPSTMHRVVNPEGAGAKVARFSAPFFLHLNPDYEIRTLESCITAANPDQYPTPITANQYLMQRLAEIGLVK